MRKTLNYFSIQNKLLLDIYIYRLLRDRTVSENLPKFPVFGTCLIHQLQLPGSQQHSNIQILEPFNLIFNLGKRKLSGGDKSGDYGVDKGL